MFSPGSVASYMIFVGVSAYLRFRMVGDIVVNFERIKNKDRDKRIKR